MKLTYTFSDSRLNDGIIHNLTKTLILHPIGIHVLTREKVLVLNIFVSPQPPASLVLHSSSDSLELHTIASGLSS